MTGEEARERTAWIRERFPAAPIDVFGPNKGPLRDIPDVRMHYVGMTADDHFEVKVTLDALVLQGAWPRKG